MPFLTSFSGGDITAIRANGYTGRQYLLIDEGALVMRAEVAFTTAAASFAEFEFANVAEGDPDDIREGYTVLIGTTSNIRAATTVLRVRRGADGNVVNGFRLRVGLSSARLIAGQFVFVIKDVRPSVKIPNSTLRDFDQPYAPPQPIINNLQSCYVGVLVGGEADFAFSPNALAVANGATISSWLWDADGGTFEAGSSTTQAVTLQYTLAGVYHPRLQVTDSNGTTNYFQFRVFVVPTDFSSVVDLGYDGVVINGQRDIGYTCSLKKFDGAANLIDYSFVAVWLPDNLTQSNDIIFCGRFRSEDAQDVIVPPFGTVVNADYFAEGVLAVMSAQNAFSMSYVDEPSPTTFNQVNTLTVWRAVAKYLCDMTTIPNIHALSFSDTTNALRTLFYDIPEGDLLDFVQTACDRIIAGLDSAPTGEIRITPDAVMQSTANRAALPTIATLTRSDVVADMSGGVLFSISRDYVSLVGLVRLGAANLIGDEMQVYRAQSPAVVPVNGQRIIEEDGHIVEASLASSASFAEVGRRCADRFATERRVTLTATLYDAWKLLQPSWGQWYEFDFTGGRWVLDEIDYRFVSAAGRVLPTATFIRETVGGDFMQSVEIPVTEQPYLAPPQPNLPPYPSFPPDKSKYGGKNGKDTSPPFGDRDVEIVRESEDPAEQQSTDRLARGTDAGVAWGDDNLYKVTGLGATFTPAFQDFTPPDVLGTIKDAKLNPFGNGLLAVSHNESNSRIHRTLNFGNTAYVPTDFVATLFERIRYAAKPQSVFVLGEVGVGDVIVYDFTVDEQGWEDSGGSVSSAGPAYLAGQGWEIKSAFGSNFFQRIRRNWPVSKLGTTFEITGGRIVFNATAAITADAKFGFTDGGNSLYASYSFENLSGAQDITYPTALTTPFPVSSYATFLLFIQAFPGAAETIISRIEFYFAGDSPDPVYTVPSPGTVSASIYSNDTGITFASPVTIGGTDALGIDTSADADSEVVFASDDSEVLEADGGGAYIASPGGDEGAALCIRAIADDDYYYAVASTKKLWRSQSGTATDITPNDGADDGEAVSENCIATPRGIGAIVFFLADFDGVVKLAYSADGGSTWAFNTQITNNANYARCKRVGNRTVVYITDDTSLWFGLWDGVATLTLTEYIAPVALRGFEPYGG